MKFIFSMTWGSVDKNESRWGGSMGCFLTFVIRDIPLFNKFPCELRKISFHYFIHTCMAVQWHFHGMWKSSFLAKLLTKVLFRCFCPVSLFTWGLQSHLQFPYSVESFRSFWDWICSCKSLLGSVHLQSFHEIISRHAHLSTVCVCVHLPLFLIQLLQVFPVPTYAGDIEESLPTARPEAEITIFVSTNTLNYLVFYSQELLNWYLEVVKFS